MKMILDIGDNNESRKKKKKKIREELSEIFTIKMV